LIRNGKEARPGLGAKAKTGSLDGTETGTEEGWESESGSAERELVKKLSKDSRARWLHLSLLSFFSFFFIFDSTSPSNNLALNQN